MIVGSLGRAAAVARILRPPTSRLLPSIHQAQLQFMATDVKGKATSSQTSWQLPKRKSGDEEPRLKVYNSLTRSKVDFVTKKAGVVTWYNCGPTVYDASHMGHARNYMTQDIMRRILRDYFGYEVQFVMNVTDVDDKIIVRARHSYLLKRFLEETASSPAPFSQQLVDTVQSAWVAYFYKSIASSVGEAPPSPSWESASASWQALIEKETDTTWLADQKTREEKWSMYYAALKSGRDAIIAAQKGLEQGTSGLAPAQALVEANADAMGLWLDKQFGATVTDPAVFRNLAAYWEMSFFEDMNRLHVERPSIMTRVSEYIPEIVDFVQGIIERGMAYEAQGNVWFDTGKFDGAQGNEHDWCHTYAKLQPWSKGNRELLEDGEGSLTSSGGKHSASDFALWKTSKPGEPAWQSPWGQGRPGWHIECSVMATAVLGDGMDVHSGGVDLAFPHHDNELAQSEAYHNCRQWVNYFLHTGHLHIEGLKMSKSLKNFITIDKALAQYSARQLRLAFLSQNWSAKLDFKESGMQEVRSTELVLNNFFVNAKALILEARTDAASSNGRHRYLDAEQDLMQRLENAQIRFRTALCDSFDTQGALLVILDLVSSTNVYISRGRKQINGTVLLAVEEWVTRMLRTFGLGEGSPTDSRGDKVVGWGHATAAGQEGASDRDTVLLPYLRSASAFRDEVRRLALGGASSRDLLVLCDRFRDEDMVDLGVALDDQEDGHALVKLVPSETLRCVRDEKIAAHHEKANRKAAAQALAEAKRLERLEKGRMPPKELFRSQSEYSAWDDKGLPTHDSDGKDLPKSRLKKLQKEWDAQKKLHEEFLTHVTPLSG